ncbi:hypothetical protein ABH903_001806 [Brevibacterium epidermidis]|jgi:hypothetical protein|uniref:Uncharacterized protein n=1 Tax=Brevibacterium epidermidis TaxID=1698 RepID=A0ABV4EJS4_BREEP
MKFLKRALVASVAVLALAVGPAVSAEAATMYFNVTKLSASDMVISDSRCKNFNVYLEYKKKNVSSWSVDSEISGEYGSSDANFSNYTSPSNKDRASICPTLDGLGKYRIGPSEVDIDNDYNWDAFTDHTKGYFYVRGKTYASLSSKRSGSTVTLTSSTKYYNPEWGEKRNYNPKVKFQVKSGSKWKTLKTVTAKKGKAVYKAKSKSKRYYRVTFSQVSWATGATSKSVKR